MEAWRHWGMETWGHGDMGAWRHGGMYVHVLCASYYYLTTDTEAV